MAQATSTANAKALHPCRAPTEFLENILGVPGTAENLDSVG